MAGKRRGPKPKARVIPPAQDDFSGDRITVYHLCGREIFCQSFPDRLHEFLYYFQYFGSREPSDQTPLQVCPACQHRVSNQSVRLPGEQYSYELAQEALALEMARQQEEEEESAAPAPDAEANPPA